MTEIPDHALVRLTVNGRWDLGGHILACPHCGAERGLTLTAHPADHAARGTCPDGHTWDETAVNGRLLRHLYTASLR